MRCNHGLTHGFSGGIGTHDAGLDFEPGFEFAEHLGERLLGDAQLTGEGDGGFAGHEVGAEGVERDGGANIGAADGVVGPPYPSASVALNGFGLPEENGAKEVGGSGERAFGFWFEVVHGMPLVGGER